jgi:hypothetical protein
VLALGAFVALPVEFVLGFPFLFAPGWANGWPGGLTIYAVWSAGMTAYLFVMMMTAGTAVGATVTFLVCLSSVDRRRVVYGFCVWQGIWTGLTIVTCTMAYRYIYALTLKEWPNGYP